MEGIEKQMGKQSRNISYQQKEIFDVLSIDKKAQEIDSMKNFYTLREFQMENYNKKVDFINSEGFKEMRALEKNEEFVLKKEGLDEKRLKKYTRYKRCE